MESYSPYQQGVFPQDELFTTVGVRAHWLKQKGERGKKGEALSGRLKCKLYKSLISITRSMKISHL